MNGAKMLAAIRELDATLAGHGFLPLTPWWDKQLETFYLHPTARTFVGEVGRGGIKTGVGCTVGMGETLCNDDYVIPPGERHFWIDLSENKDEALKTQRLYEARLKALGVPFHRSGDLIELDNMPRGFLVRANSVGAVSGWRAYGLRADELAKWPREGADPAADVISSAMAMTVTHPTAPKLFLSSPTTTTTYFNELVDAGTNEHQVVSSRCPTWIANPSITEAQTRRLEPNERRWRMEYLAIPQAGAATMWNIDEIDRAMRPWPSRDRCTYHPPIVPLDMSSGRGDAAVFAPACWGYPMLPPEAYSRHPRRLTHLGANGLVTQEVGDYELDPNFKGEARPFILFWDLFAAEGKFAEFLNFDQLANAIALHGQKWGAREVVGDQREEYALSAALPKRGMRFTSFPWSNTNKGMAVERLSRLLRDAMIILPKDEKLKREMLEFEERVLPSGTITWSGRADDRVAVLLTAMIADINGLIKGSPIRGGTGRSFPSLERRSA
jgi:hypothetical protein